MPSYARPSLSQRVPHNTALDSWQVPTICSIDLVLYRSSRPTLFPGASYTFAYNLLGNPVGVLPVTRETAEDQEKLKDYPVGEDLCFRFVIDSTNSGHD